MKILNSTERRQADQHTISNEPVASFDLMERAARSCFEWIKTHLGDSTSFHVIAGMGNNGGDGLAIARMLQQDGRSVRVSILSVSDRGSDDFEQNHKLLTQQEIPIQYCHEAELLTIDNEEVVIDALFGSGLSRAITGWLAQQVEIINKNKALVVSIDCPSGLFMEDNSNNNGAIVRATVTLTFEAPVLAFYFSEFAQFVGLWEVLSIDLDKAFIGQLPMRYEQITRAHVLSLLKQRGKHDHKGTFGHALIFAGSKGKMGAAILAAKAAMRSGVGLLTMGIPEIGLPVMQSSIPESMCIPVGKDVLQHGIALQNYSSVGVGPGIGQVKETASFLKVLIQNATGPLVLDADALNILADNKTWLSYLPAGSILTPHPGEFKRLVLNSEDSYQRLQAQITFSKRYQVIVVLKGAYTQVSLPDGRVYFNATGNPGMATGGSGDVLTGVVTGLLARGYHPMHAAILGVYLHGLAGDLAVEKIGMESLIAGDLIRYLHKAYRVLEEK